MLNTNQLSVSVSPLSIITACGMAGMAREHKVPGPKLFVSTHEAEPKSAAPLALCKDSLLLGHCQMLEQGRWGLRPVTF